MATVLRIGPYTQSEQPDSLGRTDFGFYPGITEDAAFTAGRGCWKLGPAADHQRYALIVGRAANTSTVVAAAEIHSLETDPGDPSRRYIVGRVLEPGHPIRDNYIGQPDPSGSESRNPVAYVELPEEAELGARTCACGCGKPARRDYLPGHDHKAIHDRIRKHFGGSTLRFVEWFDEQEKPNEA